MPERPYAYYGRSHATKRPQDADLDDADPDQRSSGSAVRARYNFGFAIKAVGVPRFVRCPTTRQHRVSVCRPFSEAGT